MYRSYVLYNGAVSNEDRDLLQAPVHDVKATPSPVLHYAPSGLVDTSVHRHTIKGGDTIAASKRGGLLSAFTALRLGAGLATVSDTVKRIKTFFYKNGAADSRKSGGIISKLQFMFLNFTKSVADASICSAMEAETILKNGVSPKNLNIKSRRNHSKIVFLIFFLTISLTMAYARDDDDDDEFFALQISVGYIPNQELSVTPNSNAITFDIAEWYLGCIGEKNSFHGLLGFGGGLGIRGYRKIPNEALLNTAGDKFQTSATRFDIHLGPGVGFGYNIVQCFVTPQVGLWYAGMTNEGPKVNGTFALSGDLIISILSLGVTYRMSSPRLVSTDWSFSGPGNSYILIKPALEFRIGVFFGSIFL